MLTKKDFIAMAQALYELKPSDERLILTGSAPYNQWLRDVDAMAKHCQASNPNFNIDRFRNACHNGTIQSRKGTKPRKAYWAR